MNCAPEIKNRLDYFGITKNSCADKIYNLIISSDNARNES
jgi:hypothetical protein